MGKQNWRADQEDGKTTLKKVKVYDIRRSYLADQLMKQHFWQGLSWPMVQETSYASWMDGNRHADVMGLAGLGSWGNNLQNAAKDASRLQILKEVIAPEVYDFEVSSKNRKTKERNRNVQSGALLLQDYLALLEEHYPDVLEQVFGASSARLEEFWERCSPDEDPKFHEHPMLKVAGWEKLFIPMYIHGDGAEFVAKGRDALLVTSSSPVLGEGSSLLIKFLHWVWPKTVEAKDDEDEEGSHLEHWRVMLWDLEACFLGRRPSKDHNGRHLTGWRKKVAGQPILKSGLRVVIWGVLGDLDYFFKDLGMKHWSAAGEGGMCECCPANTLPLDHPASIPWNDFKKTAWWRLLCYLASLWAALPPSEHPLWLAKLGLTRFFLMWDSLHICEQRGVASHCVGNALVTLLQEKVGRRNAGKDALEEAWKELWDDMLEITESLKAEGLIKYPLGRLELSWFWHGNNEYPCVSKAVKAAEMRDLVPVVYELCKKRLSEGSRLEEEGPYQNLPERRCYLMKHLAKYYNIMREGGLFLTQEEAKELKESVYKVNAFYSDLTKDAQKMHLKQFSQVPKFRFWEHLADQAKYLNPRSFWTYLSEDYVGKIAKMASKLLDGTDRQKLAFKLLSHYRFAWHFMMKAHVLESSQPSAASS